jgi:hypothetical protein
MANAAFCRAFSFLIILTCASWLAASAAPSLPQSPSLSLLSSRAANSGPNTDCTTDVDNDLYGKGVRIGLYLQWASGFILRQLESWETRARVRISSNIITGALAIATAVNIAQGSALSVDYLLSYYLTVVLFYAESYNLETPKYLETLPPNSHEAQLYNDFDGEVVKATKVLTDFPLVFQNFIFMSFTLYGVWYWLKGINSVADPNCGAQGALFGLFDIKSHVWTRGAAGLAVIIGFLFFIVLLLHISTLPKGIGSGARTVAAYYGRAAMVMSAGPVDLWAKASFWPGILRPEFPLASLSRGFVLRSIRDLCHYFLIYLCWAISRGCFHRENDCCQQPSNRLSIQFRRATYPFHHRHCEPPTRLLGDCSKDLEDTQKWSKSQTWFAGRKQRGWSQCQACPFGGTDTARDSVMGNVDLYTFSRMVISRRRLIKGLQKWFRTSLRTMDTKYNHHYVRPGSAISPAFQTQETNHESPKETLEN